MIDQFKRLESGLDAFAEAERRDALATVRKLCEERIAEVDQPTAHAFDAGVAWMARQVLDLLDKEAG